jgi:hypothetical protein
MMSEDTSVGQLGTDNRCAETSSRIFTLPPAYFEFHFLIVRGVGVCWCACTRHET